MLLQQWSKGALGVGRPPGDIRRRVGGVVPGQIERTAQGSKCRFCSHRRFFLLASGTVTQGGLVGVGSTRY